MGAIFDQWRHARSLPAGSALDGVDVAIRHMPMPASNRRRTPRFAALDQVRGLAIACMVAAHFGPGLYDRAGITGVTRDALGMFGRLATPSFVMIFGLTLAFAYLPRARRDPFATSRALLQRAGLVAASALLVALPGTVRTLWSNAPAYDVALQQYSVLTFYAVAIFITAFCLRLLTHDPARTGLVAGAALVLIGTVLGYDGWPEHAGTFDELMRLILVSGKYGVLVLLGCAWMMIGLGQWLRERVREGLPYRRDLVLFGFLMASLGLAQGRIVGWRTLSDLATLYDAPPQLWFLAVAGGAMLIGLAVLDRYTVPFVSALLELVGRRPMAVYVAHSFVLPGAALMEWAVPGLPGGVPVLAAMATFLLVCVWLLLKPARMMAAHGDRRYAVFAKGR